MKSLVINAGSSSIKFQVFNEENSVFSGSCEEIGKEDSLVRIGNSEKININLKNHEDAFNEIINLLEEKGHLDEVNFVVHRIVHGGEKFKESVIINEEVISELKGLIPLAPLHNPANILGAELMKKLLPNISQVAVFDTSFHSRLDKENYLYGVPYDWYKKYGIRKYGFHGSSHAYVVSEALKIIGNKKAKIISCHLGNGASICASLNGKSVDTSMGRTPLEGIIMGTRCGSIDPGIILHLINEIGLSSNEVAEALNKESGLKGLSEKSSDMRTLLEFKDKEEGCKRAIEIYINRIVKVIGSYIAILEGLDAIVFTGGTGEKSSFIRNAVTDKFKFLGLGLSEEKNQKNEIEISDQNSKIKVFVIPTNEELQMVRSALEVLKK